MPPQGGWGTVESRLVPSVIGELSAELMLNCNTHLEQRGAPAERGKKRPQDKGPEGNIPFAQSPCISDVEVPVTEGRALQLSSGKEGPICQPLRKASQPSWEVRGGWGLGAGSNVEAVEFSPFPVLSRDLSWRHHEVFALVQSLLHLRMPPCSSASKMHKCLLRVHALEEQTWSLGLACCLFSLEGLDVSHSRGKWWCSVESQGSCVYHRGLARDCSPSIPKHEFLAFCCSLRAGVQTHCGCHHPSWQERALRGSTS